MQTKRRRHTGATTVEFALCTLVFFGFLFMLVEFARMFYLVSSVHEVTRRAARAAAVSDFSDGAAMAAVRTHAVFDSSTSLPLGGLISAEHVRIDYLYVNAAGVPTALGALPGCPLQNLLNCSLNPNGSNCIRLVRARLCKPGGSASDCDPVPYVPMAPWLDVMFDAARAPISLPDAATIMPAGALGRRPGMLACP